MKPKPLDLEDIWIWFEKKFGKDAIEWHKGYPVTELIEEIKQRIKQACEFYLRYKDNPELLAKERPEYKKQVEGLKWIPNPDFEACKEGWFEQVYGKNINCKNCPVKKSCLEDGEFIENIDFLKDYNEWLFRLAFKDVSRTMR